MRVSHTGGSETLNALIPIDAPARRFRVSSARWHRVVTALLVRPLATRAAREWDAWTRTSAEAYSGGVRRLELDRAWRRRRSPARDEVGTSEWCDYIFLPGCNAARRDGVLRAHPEQEHAGSDPCLEAGVPERAQGTSKEPIEDFPRSRRRRGARHRPEDTLGVASRFSARQTVFALSSRFRRASAAGGGPAADHPTF